MAAGDILSTIISRSGSFLYVKLSAMVANGTFAIGASPSNWKIVVTVNTTGDDGTGNYIAKTRTLYGKIPMLVPFNSDHIACGAVTGGPFLNGETITQTGTGATATVITNCPCSPLFVRSTITGTPNNSGVWTGGTSGATATPTEVPTSYGRFNPTFFGVDGSDLWVAFALSDEIHLGDTATVTIASGIYNDGTRSANAATNLAVTNQSQLPYPTPMLRWNTEPGRMLTNALTAEASAYSKYGIARVKFTWSDAHGNSVSASTNRMTRSPSTTALPLSNFNVTADGSTLTDGDTITVNVEATANIGTVSQLRTSVGGTLPAITPLTHRMDKTGSRAHAMYVATTGSDTTGNGTRANPYASMGKAASAGAALNPDGKADGVIINIMDTGNLFGVGSFSTVSCTSGAITIQADPAGTFGADGISTSASITGPNATNRFQWNITRIKNLPTSGTNWAFGSNGGKTIFDNVNNSGTYSLGGTSSSVWYLRGTHNGAGGWNNGIVCLVMGPTVNGNINHVLCAVGCSILNASAAATWIITIPASLDNVILAYNKVSIPAGSNWSGWDGARPVTSYAEVCNDVWRSGTGSSTITTITSMDHFVCWNNTHAGQRDDWQNDWTNGIDYTTRNMSVIGNSFFDVAPNEDWYVGSSRGLDGTAWLVSSWPRYYSVGWYGNNWETNLYINIDLGIDGSLALARYTLPDSEFNFTFPITPISGTFQQFEPITFSDGHAGYLDVATSPVRVTMSLAGGPVAATTMTGTTSGAKATVGTVTGGAGNSNDRPLSSSPLRSKLRSGAAPLIFDLDGNPYDSTGRGTAGAYQYPEVATAFELSGGATATPGVSWLGSVTPNGPLPSGETVVVTDDLGNMIATLTFANGSSTGQNFNWTPTGAQSGSRTLTATATPSLGSPPTMSVGVAPVAPGLGAGGSAGTIALSWNAVAGAATYNVYRGTTPSGESGTPLASGLTGTTYNDTGLSPSATFYYVVKAVNTGGTSAASNEVGATTAARKLSASPGVVKTNGTNTVVTLTDNYATTFTPGTPGSPSVTVTGATKVSQQVTAGNQIMVTINTGGVGTITFDPGTGFTATVLISNNGLRDRRVDPFGNIRHRPF